MLTSETKQKINNCRDYLVWKIPDPKWQIDQITNALIYKFMSDQDILAKEIWWNASFFVDQWEKESEKYEKYSWEHLFDTKLTNEAKAKLYIDWIEQLSKAKHLPELFRDIFKNAFLPFRDANTIVLFLTEINKFDYHHSEELGNAFEYLLSIMWSQWDSWSFRTPRHIIEFLVDVVDPKPGETIYDPACGTAGFLISAFTHIMENNPKLSIPEKLELYKNISWVDIDPGMAKIARVNLYLHGFKTPKISEDDTLSNLKLWDNKYDVILANPPFMTPKWGIKPHEWYSIKSNRSEVLFTDYIAEHLRLKWRAWIIVPDWVIFKQDKSYKELRKMLVEQKLLYAVVSLPSWVFNPYAWVKTSILFLDRELASKTDKILFVKVENDWYDLWAQRREINKNDLPKSLEILKNYKTSVLENKNFETQDKNVLVVEKSNISQNGEYNLSAERYRKNSIWDLSSYDFVELWKKISTITAGIKIQKNEFLEKWDIPVIDQSQNFISWYTNNLESKNIVNKPLVIFGDHTCAVKYIDFNFAQWADWIKILDTTEDLNPKFLYYNLLYKPLQSDWYQRHFTKLKLYKIPLPPLEIQEQIIEELDNYQKIIDGAKQIVENYKPKIKIDESWEVVELGEICDVRDWTHDSPKYVESGIPLITSKNLRNRWIDFNNVNYISDLDHEKISKRSWVDDWDVLFAMIWTIWNPIIVQKNREFSIKNVALFKFNGNTKLLNKYLCVLLDSKYTENNLINLSRWWTQNFISLSDIRRFKIPLPPLEVQEEIVAKIEEEQKMVESAKWLIKVFENKIKERIGEVWGENLDDND